MTTYLAFAAALGVLLSLSDVVRSRLNGRLRGTADDASKARSQWNYFDILAVLLLISFSGLRFMVGTDYPIYRAIFNKIDTSQWWQEITTNSQEAGFTLLILVVKSIAPSAELFFWVVATLTILPIYAVAKKHSDSPATSIMLFVLLAYYSSSFNTIRQSLAVALFMVATICLRRSFRWFVVFVVLASGVHLTAAFAALVFIMVKRWSPSPRMAVGMLIGAAAVGVGLASTPLFRNWLDLLNPRYASYLESGDTGLGAYLQAVAILALLIVAVTTGKQLGPMPPAHRELAVMVFVGVLIMIVGTQAVIVVRLASYFTIFLILLLPNRLAMAKERVPLTMIVLVAAAIYYVAHLSNYGEVIPYQTYLS